MEGCGDGEGWEVIYNLREQVSGFSGAVSMSARRNENKNDSTELVEETSELFPWQRV